MSLRKYKKIKYLGKGSYGAAILVCLRGDEKKKFVVKEIVVGHLKESEQRAARKEAEVLSQMQHSNITMYIESFVEGSKLYIVMEFADGGDLSQAIANRKKTDRYWKENELMRILVQICLALKHVHDQNILHRDLKSQNIFLTNKGIVKLGDFGIAKVLDATDDQAKTQIGTPYYLSPEICESSPYGRSSDVWSLGVVTFELMALELPFQANSLPALISRIISLPPNWQRAPRHFSKSLFDLTTSMLHKKPGSRPTLKQVVSTDFLKAHISKLLSYTLNNNNGGVREPREQETSGAEVKEHAASEAIMPAPAPAPAPVAVDEAELRQFYVQQREKEQAMKADHLDQEAKREQDAIYRREREREKLRRFREDMIRKKMDDVSAGAGEAGLKLPASRYGGRALVARYDSQKGASSVSTTSSSEERSLQERYDPPAYSDVDAEATQASRANYARDQFFANRRAAAAVKARVEAEERAAGFVDNGGGGAIRSGADWDNVDAVGKIAALRAKREQEKERILAEKELELKRAHEANREERKRLESVRSSKEDPETGHGGREGPSVPATPHRARDAIAFDIDLSPGRADSSVGDVGGDGAHTILKKLRDRRSRDREAREKARLVFRRLQEQRRIQQRVQNGVRVTRKEGDRGGEVDNRVGEDDLDCTIDRFLGAGVRKVSNDSPCSPKAPGEEKEERSLSIFKQKLEVKQPFEESLSASQGLCESPHGTHDDADDADDEDDEDEDDGAGGVEDLAGMLARQLVDDGDV